jgi:hypothetical protein
MVQRPAEWKDLGERLAEPTRTFPPNPLQFEESFLEITPEPEPITDIKSLIEAALGISGAQLSNISSTREIVMDALASLDHQKRLMLTGNHQATQGGSKSPEEIVNTIENAEAKLRGLLGEIDATSLSSHEAAYASPTEAAALAAVDEAINPDPAPFEPEISQSSQHEDDGDEADWQAVKLEVLRLLQAEMLDTPASHLAYIRERINPVLGHDLVQP